MALCNMSDVTNRNRAICVFLVVFIAAACVACFVNIHSDEFQAAWEAAEGNFEEHYAGEEAKEMDRLELSSADERHWGQYERSQFWDQQYDKHMDAFKNGYDDWETETAHRQETMKIRANAFFGGSMIGAGLYKGFKWLRSNEQMNEAWGLCHFFVILLFLAIGGTSLGMGFGYTGEQNLAPLMGSIGCGIMMFGTISYGALKVCTVTAGTYGTDGRVDGDGICARYVNKIEKWMGGRTDKERKHAAAQKAAKQVAGLDPEQRNALLANYAIVPAAAANQGYNIPYRRLAAMHQLLDNIHD